MFFVDAVAKARTAVLNYFGKYEKLQSGDSFVFTEPSLFFVENRNKEKMREIILCILPHLVQSPIECLTVWLAGPELCSPLQSIIQQT